MAGREAAVFLLVGRHLMGRRPMCSRQRGHIGIEALVGTCCRRCQPYKDMAGRFRELPVLRLFAWNRGRSTHEAWILFPPLLSLTAGFQKMWAPPAGDHLCPDGIGQDSAVGRSLLQLPSPQQPESENRNRIGIVRRREPVCDCFGNAIAFAPGAVAIVLMGIYLPAASLDT